MSGIKETKPLAEIDPEMFELVAAAKRRAPWRQTRAARLGANLQAWCHGKTIPLPNATTRIPSRLPPVAPHTFRNQLLTPTRKSGPLCFGVLPPPKQRTPGANGTNLETPGHARVRSTTYVTPRQLFGKKTSKPLHDRDRFSRARARSGSKSAARGAAADALPALPDDTGRSDATHCARPGAPTPRATSLLAQRLVKRLTSDHSARAACCFPH